MAENFHRTDKVIGRGSFATVYLAQNETTQEWLAVKCIDKQKLSQWIYQSIWNEIQMMRKIHHQNVIRLYSVEDSKDAMSLYMEYCTLGDLSQFIQNHKGRNPFDGIPMYYVSSFLNQLSSALEVMRHMDLVHRDLKPQNILLTTVSDSSSLNSSNSSGTPPVLLKLCDFGFARVLQEQDMAETLCGSPLYMAPEILRYEKYDAKADLWSVGVILYEMITGKTPFRARNHIALLKKIQMTKNVLFPDEMVERRLTLNQVASPSASTSLEQQSTSIGHSSSRPIVIPSNAAAHDRYPAAAHTMSNFSITKPNSLASNYNIYAQKRAEIQLEISPMLKELTRSLLKKDPVERISFEEFFLHPCVRRSTAKINPEHAALQHPSKFASMKENVVPASLPRFNNRDDTPLNNTSPASSLSLSAQRRFPLKRSDSVKSSISQIGAPFLMEDIDEQQPRQLQQSNTAPLSINTARDMKSSPFSLPQSFSGAILPFAAITSPQVITAASSPRHSIQDVNSRNSNSRRSSTFSGTSSRLKPSPEEERGMFNMLARTAGKVTTMMGYPAFSAAPSPTNNKDIGEDEDEDYVVVSRK